MICTFHFHFNQLNQKLWLNGKCSCFLRVFFKGFGVLNFLVRVSTNTLVAKTLNKVTVVSQKIRLVMNLATCFWIVVAFINVSSWW